jgi:GNAT superfamily N-acetyltransferase
MVVLRALANIDDEATLIAVDELIMRAYGMSSRRSRVERFIRVQPGGWVVAEEATANGTELVGCGGCIAYPDGGFGWIGLIAVEPSTQGKGIGRIVTQWLIDHLASLGCLPVLDGSPSGAPLYETMGFVDHGLSTLLVAPEGRVPAQPSTLITLLTVADLNSVYAYDKEVFGADRSALLRYLNQESPGRAYVSRSNHGSVNGFVMVQDTVIGPLVADNQEVFDDLIAAALRSGFRSSPTVCVPPGSIYHEHWLAAGFIEVRALRRQHLGVGQLPGAHQFIGAQTSFGEG